MISGIIKGIIGLFSTGLPQKIGNVVADGAALIALAPIFYWFLSHKEEEAIAVSLTWGELAFFGAIAFFMIKIVHYTRPGNPTDRGRLGN